MKKIITTIIVLLSVFSCKKDDLASEFDCGSNTNSYELKEYQDIFKKYKIKLPKSWKTQLYYDEFQSQIFSADTTKSLADTYILDISWHQGELNLDKNFAQRVKDTLATTEQLEVLKSNFSKFKDRPSYWTLSAGKKGKYNYKNLQVYVKTHPDEYYTFTTKVYGDVNIDERLCESISLSLSVEIKE